jgi:hypothetical protein
MPLPSKPLDSPVSLTQAGKDFITVEAGLERGTSTRPDLLSQLDLARWISSQAATGKKSLKPFLMFRNKTK